MINYKHAFKTTNEVHPCCCCLLRPVEKDLKTPYAHLDRTEIYSDMLQECFDIRMIPNGNLSGICEPCVGRLRDATDFKLQVQRCQEELEAWLIETHHNTANEYTIKSESSYEPKVKLEPSVEPITVKSEPSGEPTVKSEPSDDEASDNYVLYEAISVKTEMYDGMNDEDVVSYSLKTMKNISARAREQLAMTCSVRLERLRDDKAPLACPTCLHTFHHEASLATHMRDAHPDSCAVSHEGDYLFDREASLATHMLVHDVESSKKDIVKTPQDISNTGDKKQTNDKSKDSLRKQTEKPFRCGICSREFRLKFHLLRHQNSHVKKTFTCEVCNKQFAHHGNLNQHRRLHTGERRYKCEVCNMRLISRTSLDRHRTQHEEYRTIYPCKICKKHFRCKYTLQVHNRLHTGDKPYSCVQCDKHYTQLCNLKKHTRRVHAEEMPYACGDCEKLFSTKYELGVHARVHTG